MKDWDFSKGKVKVLDAYREERDNGAYNAILKNYKDPATRYAFMTLEEQVLTPYSIKLDAFRHLQDLRRSEQDRDDFPYVYNLDYARRIVQFAALCPNPDSGRPTPLMAWQLAILCKIVGWRRKDDNTPRFGDVVVSVSRTNGKTYLSEILIAYSFLLDIDKLHNQDLLYAGITSDQTGKGFRYIMSTFNLLKETPGFKKLFKRRAVHVVSDKVADNLQNQLLKMSQQSGVFDSYHFKLAVVDEAGSNEMPIGRIKENKSKITTGMTQTGGQIVQISTAYPDSNSYLYHEEKMMVKAMEEDSKRTLDDHLCMIWQQDNIKEVDDYKTWIKSNPLMGLSDEKRISMVHNLVSKRDTALESGTIGEFENKSLNLWLQAKVNSYLTLEDVEKATTNNPPKIDGRDVFIGLDLAHFSDDAGCVFTIPYFDTTDSLNKFYLSPLGFIPTARSQGSIDIKMAQDGIDYKKSEELGYSVIAKNKFGYVDDEVIYDKVLSFVEQHRLNVKAFLYDAWEAGPLIQRFLEKTDWTCIPVRQGTLSLSHPTTYFRKLMDTGRITYPDDPALKSALTNAVLLEDNNGVKVDKDRATAKIDLVDAIIDTMFRAQYYFDGLNPDHKEDNKNPFNNMSKEEQNDYFDDLINLNF